MKVRRPARAAILTAALAASVTAGGIAAAASPAQATAVSPHARVHEIDITGAGHRYRIDTHGVIKAGLVRVAFRNEGPEPHQAQLFLLQGVSFGTFRHDLLSKGIPDGLPWGGAAMTRPGQTQAVYAALQGGTYAVVCFVAGKDGVPHFAMGMISSFSVAGHLSPGQLARLHPHVPVAGTITAHDMTYTMPAVLRSGALYRFSDTDAMDAHELNIGRLLPGKIVRDVIAWARTEKGQPPFIPWGGSGALIPHGVSAWFRLDATPGRYVAFCLIPDDKTHMPHAVMGMVVPFSVR